MYFGLDNLSSTFCKLYCWFRKNLEDSLILLVRRLSTWTIVPGHKYGLQLWVFSFLSTIGKLPETTNYFYPRPQLANSSSVQFELGTQRVPKLTVMCLSVSNSNDSNRSFSCTVIWWKLLELVFSLYQYKEQEKQYCHDYHK